MQIKYKLVLSLFSTVVCTVLGTYFFASGKSQQACTAFIVFGLISLTVSVVYLGLYLRIGKRN